MKRIISFDIGIKNMAYCIFDLSCENFKILDWNVLNLLPEKEASILCNQCSQKEDKKKKKEKIENFFISSSTTCQIPKTKCGKIAKYKKGEETFCEKHSKTSSYKKIILPSNLSKKSVTELRSLYDSFQGNTDAIEEKTKKSLIEKIQTYVENHGLKPIKEVKTSTSNNIDLVSIGHALNRLMTEVLDKIDPENAITHVIIENQISPIANRMKTVQGMLAQYFIMKYKCHIEFISSANKLKIFSIKDLNKAEKDKDQKEKKEVNPEYKKHKKDGIFYCRGILESNEWLKGHIDSLNTKKKDDLADCFLQGIWYMVNKKRIFVAENLKINSVIKV
jgi:hypothetical protein